MEDEEKQQSTVEEPDAAVAEPKLSGVHARGVFAVVVLTFLITLVVRRIGRSNLAGELRRWIPLLFASVWGSAALVVTLIYAQGLSSTWFLGIWLLFLVGAFTSVGSLRSVVAGVAISLEGRISLGDAVRISDLSGEVISFGVRSLRLRATDGSIHEIPNERIVTEPVTNLSGDGGDSATELVFGLPEGIDAQSALEVARRIAILSPLASPRHRPEVFLEARGLDGSQFDLRVRGYAFDAAFQDHFRSDVVARLQAALANRELGRHHVDELTLQR